MDIPGRLSISTGTPTNNAEPGDTASTVPTAPPVPVLKTKSAKKPNSADQVPDRRVTSASEPINTARSKPQLCDHPDGPKGAGLYFGDTLIFADMAFDTYGDPSWLWQMQKYEEIKQFVLNQATAFMNQHQAGFSATNARLTIALAVAKQFPLAGKFMDCFAFDTAHHRFLFACAFAEAQPYAAIDLFQKFALPNDTQRYLVAKIIATKEPDKSRAKIASFNIVREDLRMALARIYAAKGASLELNLPEFKLTDPDYRFEIAQILCSKDPLSAIEYFFNFKLADDKLDTQADKIKKQEQRYALAVTCLAAAEERGQVETVLYCAANFGLDPAHLDRLILEGIKFGSYGHSAVIENYTAIYPGADKWTRTTGLLLTYELLGSPVLEHGPDYGWWRCGPAIRNGLGDRHPSGEFFEAKYRPVAGAAAIAADPTSHPLVKALNGRDGFLAIARKMQAMGGAASDAQSQKNFEKFQRICKQLKSSQSSPDDLLERCKSLRSLLMVLDLQGVSRSELNAALPLLEKVLGIGDSKLRNRLIFLIHQKGAQLLTRAVPHAKGANLSGPYVSVVLAILAGNADYLLPPLQASLASGARLKNWDLLAKAFLDFSDLTLFSNEDKRGILDAVFTKGEVKGWTEDAILDRIRMLNLLVALSKDDVLALKKKEQTAQEIAKAVVKKTTEPTLEDMVKSVLHKRLKVGADYAGYQATFGAYRDPTSIPVYAGKIAAYPRSMLALQEWVASVIAGTYPESRYRAPGTLLSRLDASQLAIWKANTEDELLVAGPVGQPSRNYRLQFTDDHQQMIRMGSDMSGSCQRIDGDPRLNHVLIFTVLDQAAKICTITDKGGHIQARLILRLMARGDADTGQPCLLMERIYPVRLDQEMKDRLMAFAFKTSASMRLDVFAVKADVEGDFDPNGAGIVREAGPLSSGLLANPVYSDAAGGITQDKIQITQGLYRVFST